MEMPVASNLQKMKKKAHCTWNRNYNYAGVVTTITIARLQIPI